MTEREQCWHCGEAGEMRFGVCAGPEALDVLSQSGYDYIELGIAGTLRPEESEESVLPPLIAQFQMSRLKSEAYNLLLPGDLKVVGPETDTDRQSRYLDAAFTRARVLGGEIAVFGSGGARRIPDGWPPEDAREQVLAFLQVCGDAALRHGMAVAIESLNVSECNFINSVAEADALASEASHPAVGVLSDLYHITHDGQSYEETGQAVGRLRHVHVAGEGRRAPVAADFEYLRGYFAVLKAVGYTGRISIEGTWEDLAAQAADSLAVLKAAWAAA